MWRDRRRSGPARPSRPQEPVVGLPADAALEQTIVESARAQFSSSRGLNAPGEVVAPLIASPPECRWRS